MVTPPGPWPKIGDAVNYHFSPEVEPVPAVVVAIASDGLLDLSFLMDGRPFTARQVAFGRRDSWHYWTEFA